MLITITFLLPLWILYILTCAALTRCSDSESSALRWTFTSAAMTTHDTQWVAKTNVGSVSLTSISKIIEGWRPSPVWWCVCVWVWVCGCGCGCGCGGGAGGGRRVNGKGGKNTCFMVLWTPKHTPPCIHLVHVMAPLLKNGIGLHVLLSSKRTWFALLFRSSLIKRNGSHRSFASLYFFLIEKYFFFRSKATKNEYNRIAELVSETSLGFWNFQILWIIY